MKKDERMKPRRQEKIREIVENNIVETQEELTAFLRQEHITATQATVSRETGDGRSRYAFPKAENGVRRENRLEALFADAVTGVDASGNLVVLRTLPGMANAVASALDTAQWKNIIGTVAGDDTILAVIKPESAASTVAERMKVLSGAAGGNAVC